MGKRPQDGLLARYSKVVEVFTPLEISVLPTLSFSHVNGYINTNTIYHFLSLAPNDGITLLRAMLLPCADGALVVLTDETGFFPEI